MKPVGYQLGEAGEVAQVHDINGVPLRFEAQDVRQERTGVHARLTITLGTELLAWTAFNVERDEDRVRLANSAYGHMGDIESLLWEKSDMKHGLDLFCAGLWQASIGRFNAELMCGEGGDVQQDFPLEPYIIRGGGTMLFAPPGRGKSYSAMLMAVSVDAGMPGLFPGVKRARKGLYINIERSRDSMKRRLMQVNAALGLEPERPLLFINARGKSLADVIDAARTAVREHKVEVTYLDSVSRAGFGDLNENSSVNRIIDNLNGLCDTWFAIAHTPRQDESHIFGSIHFDAGIDVGVQMLSETREDGRTIGIGLKISKANDIRRPDKPFMYALEFDDYGLSNVRPAREREFLQLEGGKTLTPEDAIREFLLSYGWADASEINQETGVPYTEVSRVLNRVGWATKRREGKRVFWGAAV